MPFVMHPDMVYQYSVWTVGLLLVGLGIIGAIALELTARRLLPPEFRRRHNEVAAPMFAVIGTTYAVLLAFVAMLAWEGFNKAKATSAEEAAIVLDVNDAALGVPEAAAAALANALHTYLAEVITVEWPAQAAGRPIDLGRQQLDAMTRIASGLAPTDAAATTRQANLLATLARLSDVRQERMLAAKSTVPPIIWVVLVFGGALTIACASFLGVPHLAMHLAMVTALTMSGALVLILIIALSNPFRGDFRVSTEPFDLALAHIRAAADPP